MRHPYAYLGLALICMAMLSCGMGGSVPIPEKSEIIPSYLPYVEDITLPERIVANESFTVSLHLSAQLKPEILNGFNPIDPWRVFEMPNDMTGVTTIKIRTWIAKHSFSGDPMTTVDFEIPGLPVGNHKLMVETADTKQHGGFQGEFEVGLFFGPLPHEYAAIQEHAIIVEPAEDE
ncbi:hypothetical protein J7K50_06815 [bacterium]|nr:hypothetical protein [bacterium]